MRAAIRPLPRRARRRGRAPIRSASLRFVPLAAGLVALAGCGGGAHGYTLAASKACFSKDGYLSASVTNQALPGSGGDLRVSFSLPGAEDVYLVFGRDAKEAMALEGHAVALAERSFASHHEIFPRSAVLAGVQVSGNVFYYSATGAISQSERTKVAACLH
jgi:hypothetical protein